MSGKCETIERVRNELAGRTYCVAIDSHENNSSIAMLEEIEC